ncbi:phage tail protein, partial [Acinetobacter baumannii]
PDRILIFVDDGAVRSTLANGLSFEYAYTLTMILTDYAGDLAAVSIPLLDWVRMNQSNLMANLDNVKSGIKFEAEILANDKVDLAIQLPLTERVIVKQ